MLALVKGRPGRIAAQGAVLAVVIGASVIYANLDKTVTLSIDGQTTEVRSFSSTVEDLLDNQGITTGERDIVAPDRSASLREGDTVVVRYARPLTLTVDGSKRVYWTTELSVDRALSALGVRAEGASLSASRSQRIERDGLAMWLSTPKQVTLIADGDERKLTTVAPTVAALLTEHKLEVRPLDKLSTLSTATLRNGSVVKITRIDRKRVTKTETIAYSTTTRRTSSLFEGTTEVVTQGQEGKRSAVYDLVLTDGKETKRTLFKATVTEPPVTRVIRVGTKAKPAPSTGSGSGGSGSGGGTPGGTDLNWAALADCESSGNPRAVNPAGYYGLYQFSLPTWRAQGGSGNPIDASPSEQTRRAQILYNKTGPSSWPSCGPRLYS